MAGGGVHPGRGEAVAPTAPASAPGRGLTTWPPGSLTWQGVAPHQERGPHPGPSPLGQQPPGVVAVCPRPCGMPGSSPGRQGRAACASRQISPRGQRFGRPIPRPGRPVAPQKWGPAAPGRGGRQPPEGLVAMPCGPCVAGGHCLPGRRRRRLPGVRRQAGGAWGARPGHPSSPRWPSSGTGRRTGPSRPSRSPRTANRAAWWRCPLGHSWRAAISARAWGSDCPYGAGRKVPGSFNDLATRDPAVAAEWDRTSTEPLTPQMVTAGSHKKPGGGARKTTCGRPWSTPAPAPKRCARCAQVKQKQTRGRPYATLPSPRAHP